MSVLDVASNPGLVAPGFEATCMLDAANERFYLLTTHIQGLLPEHRDAAHWRICTSGINIIERLIGSARILVEFKECGLYLPDRISVCYTGSDIRA